MLEGDCLLVVLRNFKLSSTCLFCLLDVYVFKSANKMLKTFGCCCPSDIVSISSLSFHAKPLPLTNKFDII